MNMHALNRYGATLIDNATNPTTGKPYTGGDMLSVFWAVLTGAMSLGQVCYMLYATPLVLRSISFITYRQCLLCLLMSRLRQVFQL
jgi:hypothetical protein